MAEKRHDGGGVGPFSFDFPSIKQEHIKVSVNNEDPGSSAYFFNSYNSTTGGSIEFNSNTAPGTKNVRIYRQTDGTNLEHTFQVGSSIKASDLNDSNKQALFLAEENRESINSLAAGDATGAIQISGSNIADNSITTGKILDLEVKSGDIASHNSDDTLRAITTDHIRDGAVTDAKLATGITGSKVTPNFGSQNITTTGTIASGDITISDQNPKVVFTDTDNNPDYTLIANNGEFFIRDDTNDTIRLQVNTDGHVDVTGNLDVGAGADVTGNLTVSGNNDVTGNVTVSGNSTFNNGISTNGKDVYTGNAAFIASDTAGAFADRSGTNIDHIWHDESDNAWNFVSDDPYKATGNSKIRAGSFYGDGSTLSNIGNVKQIYEASSTGSSSTSSNNYADKLTLSVSTSSNTRVIVFYSWEMKHSSTNNARVYAKFTGSNDSPAGGDREFSQSGTTLNRYEGHVLDIGSHSGTRTYKIQWRRQTSGNGLIQNAYLVAIAFNV